MTRRALGMVVIAMSPLAVFAQEEGFTSLFDGKTLSGWEGDMDWFRVEDAAIVAGTLDKPIPRNEFLCTTEEYGDFELRLSVKLVDGIGNAGIQLRSQRVPNNHEVSGYQADMGQQYWGCLYDESRRNRVLVEVPKKVRDDIVKSDAWNDYIIRCEGPRIQLWLNGKQTVDYTEEEDGIAGRGIIGLQIHGGPASEARYKNIRIKKL